MSANGHRLKPPPRPIGRKPAPVLRPDHAWRLSLKPGDPVELEDEEGIRPEPWEVWSVGDTEITVGIYPGRFLRFCIRTGERVTGGMKGRIRTPEGIGAAQAAAAYKGANDEQQAA